MMEERIDVRTRTCVNCSGSGKDPRKRKRPCPTCMGTGIRLYCTSCGEDMPCSGTLDNIMDQPLCASVREYQCKVLDTKQR